MKDKHEVIATRMIEPDLDLYDTFFDHAWAVALSERAPEPLRAAVDNL